jgi:hypothetical protein
VAGVLFPLNLLGDDKGEQTLPTWGNCSLFLSPGTHLDISYLNYCSGQLRFLMEIWVAHGNFVLL